MNVFISWSGKKSREVALALREWLPSVLQAVKPWMSAEDIDAGARWNAEINKQLESTTVGILCLTKTNQTRPWVMFEAGALAKTLQGTFVIPYLIDLAPAEVEAGPLTQFQIKVANKDDTWHLLLTLNKALTTPLPEDQLRRTFEKFWPDLEEVLSGLPEEGVSEIPTRPTSEVIEEILVTVRDIARRQLSPPTRLQRASTGVKLSRALETNAELRRVFVRLWTDPILDTLMEHTSSREDRITALMDYLRMYMDYTESWMSADDLQTVFSPLLQYFNERYGDTGTEVEEDGTRTESPSEQPR